MVLFSVIGSITSLTLIAMVLHIWFLWSFRKGYKPNFQESSTISPSATIQLLKVKTMLFEANKDGIKELIESENVYLNPLLRIINVDASKVWIS